MNIADLEGMLYAEYLASRSPQLYPQRRMPIVICVTTIGDLLLATPLIRAVCLDSGHRVDVLTNSTSAPVLRDNPHVGRVHIWNDAEIQMGEQVLLVNSLLKQYSHWYSARSPLRLMRLLCRSQNRINFYPNPFFERLLIFSRLQRLVSQKATRRYHSKLHCVDWLLMMHKSAAPEECHTGTLEMYGQRLPEWLDREVEERGKTPAIGIHLGGSQPIRRLRVDMLITLIKSLNARVFLLGGEGDRSMAENLIQTLPGVVSTVGRLNLNETYSLLRVLDVCVAPDSVVMHMAAAANTPLVALMGNQVVGFIGPYKGNKRTVILHRHAHCSPCKNTTCSVYNGHSCIQDFTADEIRTAIQKILMSPFTDGAKRYVE